MEELPAGQKHGNELIRTWTEPYTKMEFVLINGGAFMMGDIFGDGNPDEYPVHNVYVNTFWIGRYPVTADEYEIFLGETGHQRPDDDGWGLGRRPAVRITWDDAVAFASWLASKTGQKFRLPTEAEWEYAARSGGKHQKWSGTNDDSMLTDFAWFDANAGDRAQPVGKKQPNSLGLYDMSGNIWEWVSDFYSSSYYETSPYRNPAGPDSGEYHVLRGGCYIYDPGIIRNFARLMGAPDTRCFGKGFRLVVEK